MKKVWIWMAVFCLAMNTLANAAPISASLTAEKSYLLNELEMSDEIVNKLSTGQILELYSNKDQVASFGNEEKYFQIIGYEQDDTARASKAPLSEMRSFSTKAEFTSAMNEVATKGSGGNTTYTQFFTLYINYSSYGSYAYVYSTTTFNLSAGYKGSNEDYFSFAVGNGGVLVTDSSYPPSCQWTIRYLTGSDNVQNPSRSYTSADGVIFGPIYPFKDIMSRAISSSSGVLYAKVVPVGANGVGNFSILAQYSRTTIRIGSPSISFPAGISFGFGSNNETASVPLNCTWS